MTGDDMRDARAALGERWGFGRPLKGSELGRAMRLKGRDPGNSIRDYERGVTEISGPISALIEMFLAGALPPDGIEAIKTYKGQIFGVGGARNDESPPPVKGTGSVHAIRLPNLGARPNSKTRPPPLGRGALLNATAREGQTKPPQS